jgi:sporulation protein YlmC with PRC-barrel domain
MPQDRVSGAEANIYGRETARKIAIAIGAISISETSNEFELDGRKITIRCARKDNNQFGVPYQILERVNTVIGAVEQKDGDYKLYEISSDKFKENMRPTKSTGPSAGRVGIVGKSVFINEGKFIRTVKLETKKETKRENKIWRMAFRCGNQGPSLWEECKKLDVAAITYNSLARVDLTSHKYNEPHSLWSKLSPSQKSSLRHVAYDMKNGDTIYVKEGTQIICKGTVLGKSDRAYVFDESFRIVDSNGTPWPHQVPVAWDASFKPINILLGAEQNAVLELNGERLKTLQKALSSTGATIIEDKIARISWNTEGWKFPSGPLGKSSDPNSYEAQHGYGHEEWLFDRSRIIDGFHYAFLEPLNVESGKHYGKVYDISLFTINGSGQKLYVGDIRKAICISKDEAEKAYRIYGKNGWIKEMADDIRRVGADPAVFLKNLSKYIFNVKFRFEDVKELDELEEISKEDVNITTNRLRLLSKKNDFLINKEIVDNESEGEDRNETPRKAVFKKEVEYDPYHSKMQNALKRLLKESYQDEYDKVCIEKGRIDIKARTKSKKWHYFEIKTDTPKNCIRSALGQIMEYAYWPDSERAEKLIIVGRSPLDNDAARYIGYIRDKFRIPVYYRSLDMDNKILSKDY